MKNDPNLNQHKKRGRSLANFFFFFFDKYNGHWPINVVYVRVRKNQ